MRTRQGTRHLLISAGLLICTLALVLLLLGLVCEGGYFGARWGLCVGGGAAAFYLAPYPVGFPSGWVAIPAESDYLVVPYISRNTNNGLMLLMPVWPLVVAAGAGVILVWRYYGLVLPGHCKECGYDLRGNTTGRCSECGTSIATI